MNIIQRFDLDNFEIGTMSKVQLLKFFIGDNILELTVNLNRLHKIYSSLSKWTKLS